MNWTYYLHESLLKRMAKEYWNAFHKINRNKEYGGETDEAYKDTSEPVSEKLFNKTF